MKMAQGYVTEDGTFFESKLEAELYEAEVKIRSALSAVNGALDAERFLEVVLAIMPEMRRYVDAYDATYTAKRDQQAKDEDGGEAGVSGAPTPDASLGHVSSTEEDLASLLKLPTRGHSNVPDVGSGSRPKEVQKRRTKHGA
jgi:hypothetical protein